MEHIEDSIPSIPENTDIPSIPDQPSEQVSDKEKESDKSVVTKTTEASVTEDVGSIEFVTTQEIQEDTQNVTMYSDTRVKKPENFDTIERPIDELFGFPQYSSAKLQEVLKRLPNIDFGDAKDIQRWKLRLNESLQAGTFDDMFKDSLERKDSDWVNSINHNGFNISPGYPRIDIKERTVSGERGLIHLASHIGQGSVYQQGLYHSGFWITFKPPGDDQIIELNRIIGSDKIELGRETYGAVFANTSVYTMKRLVNFAMANLYNHSVQIDKNDKINLIDLVSVHDYFPLLQGLAATIYPRGLMYESSCVKDPSKCTHVTKDLLNLAKVLVVDKSALTDAQKQHMTKRAPGSMSVASVKKYQEELTKLGDRKITIPTNIGTTVSFTLTIPNLPSAMKIGTEWIDGIVNHVEELAGSGVSKDDKEELFARYSLSSYLNRYAHFIKSLSFGIFEECTDPEDIKRYLPQLSSDDSIRTNLDKEIKKFINDTTISVVGIPLYDCENCGEPQTNEVVYPRHQNIIPLDVPNVFSTRLSAAQNDTATLGFTHIQDDRFGEGKKPIRFLIDACKRITTKLCNSDVKIVLRDMYEDYYGIYPHLSKPNRSKPLASVAMHPCENKTDNSLLEEAMSTYLKSNVMEFFGLNWNEYISQPKEIIDMMLKLADKKMSEKSNSADDVENKLRREMAAIQGNKKLSKFKLRK